MVDGGEAAVVGPGVEVEVEDRLGLSGVPMGTGVELRWLTRVLAAVVEDLAAVELGTWKLLAVQPWTVERWRW